MSEQILRDRNGNPIGTMQTRPNGTVVGRDRSGNVVGEFDPKQNVTRDRNGNRVGDGNLVAALLMR